MTFGLRRRAGCHPRLSLKQEYETELMISEIHFLKKKTPRVAGAKTTNWTLPDEIPGMGSYNLEVPNFGLCCSRGRAETRLSPNWHSRRHELQSNLSVEPNDHRPCVYRATPLMTSTPRHFQPNPRRPSGSSPECRCRPPGPCLRLTQQ